MKKLTLSIYNKEKIEWIKAFAKSHDTSVSKLFEDYLDTLMAFDQTEVMVSEPLQRLRQPGQRPTSKQIEKHLAQRRNRPSSKK